MGRGRGSWGRFLEGVAVLVVRIPSDFVDLAGKSLDSHMLKILAPINMTEVQEFLFAVFILIFMVSLMRRVSARYGEAVQLERLSGQAKRD